MKTSHSSTSWLPFKKRKQFPYRPSSIPFTHTESFLRLVNSKEPLDNDKPIKPTWSLEDDDQKIKIPSKPKKEQPPPPAEQPETNGHSSHATSGNENGNKRAHNGTADDSEPLAKRARQSGTADDDDLEEVSVIDFSAATTKKGKTALPKDEDVVVIEDGGAIVIDD